MRHGTHAEVGKVLSGRSEIALDDRGRIEAEVLAGQLDGTPLASVHASPRRRARETAAPVAKRRGLEIRNAAGLDEIDFGSFTGRRFGDLAGDPAWDRWNAERGHARCPGGETMAEAVGRAKTYIAAIPPEDMPAVCVSHCDVIRGIVADLLGLDYGRMFAFECDPASITTLEFGQNGARLVRLNVRT